MFEMFRNLLNICFFVWSCSCQSFAQNANIDSLNTLLKKEKNDSSRTLVLIDLASNYIGYDTLKCDEALQGAFILLKKHPWDYNRGYYYDIKSQAALFRGNAELSLILEDSALFFYNKALKTPDGKINENARYQIASVTVEKGSSYNTLGRNDEAIKFFLYGLELLEQSKLPEKITAIATCENNIATLYFRMEQYEKGLEYDLRSIPHHLLTKDTENK